MSDIFEEVEDSLRQDRTTELWKRYSPILWAAVLLIVGAVAWREMALNRAAAEQTARVEVFEAARAALEEGNYVEAQDGLRQLLDEGADVAPLASHLLARSLYEGGGDAAAAVSELERVGTGTGDDPLERLARLKAAYLQSESLTLADLETFLGGLHAEDGALGALALELVAAKAFSEGDLARAREEFSYLRFAANAPQGVVQRAELALTIIPVTRAATVPDEQASAEDDQSAPESAPVLEEETAQ